MLGRVLMRADLVGCGVFHEMDEHVLQPGADLAATRTAACETARCACSSAAASSPLTCSVVPNATACCTPGTAAKLLGELAAGPGR